MIETRPTKRDNHLQSLPTKLNSLYTLGGTVVAIGALAIWGYTVFDKLERSAAGVVTLERRIAELENKISALTKPGTGIAGPQGEPGIVGPAGPIGPQGPKGDPGQGFDSAQLNSVVTELIGKQLETLKKAVGSGAKITNTPVDAFDFSQCISINDFQKNETAVIRKGLEICARDGRMLTKVVSVSENGLNFATGGAGTLRTACSINNVCSFKQDGIKPFLIDRFMQDEDGSALLIRFNNS